MDKKSVMPFLAVLYGAGFVSAFNENLVSVALVDIMAEFGITAGMAQWLVTGYMITTSIIVVVSAFLVQRFSLRKLFFTASICMIAGEFLCMVLPTYPLVLAARLLQAVGTGFFIPLMMNSVMAVAPRERLGTLLAIGSACIVLGPAFAPVISGAAATFFGWRFIFVFPMVACAVFALAGLKLLRNIGEPKRIPLDIFSLILAGIGLTLFVYGLGAVSTNLALGLGTTVAGIAVLAWFVVRQGHLGVPMLEMSLMRNWRFSISCFLVVVAMMMALPMGVLIPLFLVGTHGMSPLMAGIPVLPAALVNAVTAGLGGRIIDKKGPWPLIPLGLALVLVGLLGMIWGGAIGSLAVVLVACVFVFGGVGFTMNPSQTTGLRILPPPMHPHGISIGNVLTLVAASIGTSLYVGVFESAQFKALAQGAAEQSAVLSGFIAALVVAAIIAGAGLAVSIAYARKNDNRRIAPLLEELAAQFPGPPGGPGGESDGNRPVGPSEPGNEPGGSAWHDGERDNPGNRN
ncbi:MAG: MFS transporter [Coriobacteriales bacterium]